MRRLIYYVAVSLDGYICGPSEDISAFIVDGNGVAKYLADLNSFDTVIMGRKTYEFGYRFGLKPGDAPYAHMLNLIFSDSLVLPGASGNVKVLPVKVENVLALKQRQHGTDIYLCGGGKFAGWSLDNELIDELWLKVNPMILGQGIKVFEGISKTYQMQFLRSESFEKGLQILQYKIAYH